MLGKEKVLGCRNSFNAKKEMEMSHVFDREGVTEFVDGISYKCGDASCDNNIINIHKTIA
jgi:hypothetical protein